MRELEPPSPVPGRPRVRPRYVVGVLLLLGLSVYWVLELLVVVTKVLDPQEYFAFQLAYTGLWLVLWGGVLVWGWRRLLAPERRPHLDEDGHARFDSDDPRGHEPGQHPGFTEGNEPPKRW